MMKKLIFGNDFLNYKYFSTYILSFYIISRAFGLVLYEMLKLKSLFNGTDALNKIKNFRDTDLNLTGIKTIYQDILLRYFH